MLLRTLRLLLMEAEEDFNDGFELFKGAEGEVIADLELGVQELDKLLRVVLLVQDFRAQEGLLLLHILHSTK